MRSDARGNRDRILDTAMDAYAAGDDPSLREIARRAGVGQGTLYRHFPNRESLVLRVYWYEMERLAADVPELLRTREPFDALCEWIRRLAHWGTSRAGMTDALDGASTGRSAAGLAEICDPLHSALATLLQANQEAGTVEAGLTVGDVLLLLGFLWRVGHESEGRARADRMLDVVLRGLRVPVR